MTTPDAGILVICPTPIGNLEDITLRTIRVLRESAVIFAEDTRVTKTLLRRFEIGTPLRSFPPSAQARRLRELCELLRGGATVAMVTDAGMPGISDPGSELVRTARECGARVDVLPGPSAVLGALVASGFDVSSFRFDGFPPRKAGERRTYLEALGSERRAVVWFEAPTRVRSLLQAVAEIVPLRRVFVLREYTKRFEQQICGTAAHVLTQLADPPRGEFTIVLEAAARERPDGGPASSAQPQIEAAIEYLIARGLSAKDATEALRLATGMPRNELYRRALAAKKS